MTDLNYPREHAGDTNFTSGSATGTPTKVDPGAAAEAQGFIPGVAVGAQNINYSVNQVTRSARYMAEQALQSLAPLRADLESSYLDTVWDGTGAVFVSDLSNETIVMKGNIPGGWLDRQGVLDAYSWSAAGGVNPLDCVGNLQSGEHGMVSSGSVPVAISLDDGVLWRPITPAALTTVQRKCDRVGQRLLVGGAVGSIVTTVAPSTLGGTIALSNGAHTSTAVVSRDPAFAGHALVLRSSAGIAIGTDENTGLASLADTGGSFVGTLDSIGDLTTDGTNYYWAGYLSSGDTSLQVSVDDGANWSQVSTITHPFTPVSATHSHAVAWVPGTSVVWLAARDTSEIWWLYASADGGLTWAGPRKLAQLTSSSVVTLSVADGYLYVGVPGRPMLRTFWRLA